MPESVHHPAHYGGEDNPYEAIKVIEAWELGFCLGNTVKYISRAGKKDPEAVLQDLEKASWYLKREIENRKKEPEAAIGVKDVGVRAVYVQYKPGGGDLFTEKLASIQIAGSDLAQTVADCAAKQMNLSGKYTLVLLHKGRATPYAPHSIMKYSWGYLDDGAELKLVKDV
jgi:hypothetical protein